MTPCGLEHGRLCTALPSPAWVRSARNECLDLIFIFSDRHLTRVGWCVGYFNWSGGRLVNARPVPVTIKPAGGNVIAKAGSVGCIHLRFRCMIIRMEFAPKRGAARRHDPIGDAATPVPPLDRVPVPGANRARSHLWARTWKTWPGRDRRHHPLQCIVAGYEAIDRDLPQPITLPAGWQSLDRRLPRSEAVAVCRSGSVGRSIAPHCRGRHHAQPTG